MPVHLSLVVVTSPDVAWPISFDGKQCWVLPTLLPLGAIFELPRVPNFPAVLNHNSEDNSVPSSGRASSQSQSLREVWGPQHSLQTEPGLTPHIAHARSSRSPDPEPRLLHDLCHQHLSGGAAHGGMQLAKHRGPSSQMQSVLREDGGGKGGGSLRQVAEDP